MSIPANYHAKENSKGPENSPVIGDDWNIERVDFIHYAKSTKPPAAKTDTCYKLMGVKWPTTPVSYVINPTNPQGLLPDFVTSAVSTSAETWDDATGKELFNNAYATDDTVKYGVLDGKNAIVFGSYPQSGVIAVTSVWYDRRTKSIVEFDMLFDTDFVWGDGNANPSLMDLQNIATHELGHSVGLSDIYSGSCTAVTMYGYSDNGDIDKRTLEPADITGLQSMYWL